jgi:DNA-binding SARP family transcriptional activator
MLALYGAGRQADALAAYRRAYAALADGLGVAPSPRLRALEAAILRHELGETGVKPRAVRLRAWGTERSWHPVLMRLRPPVLR